MEDTFFARFHDMNSSNQDILPIDKIFALLRLLFIAIGAEAVSNKMTTLFPAGWCKEVQLVDKCHRYKLVIFLPSLVNGYITRNYKKIVLSFRFEAFISVRQQGCFSKAPYQRVPPL